jgi:hypothetical protein
MLTVYVPAEGTQLELEPGAAIVGRPTIDGESVLIDVQGTGGGDRPRAEFERFIDRVRYAAGRHRDRYPTSTRRLVAAPQLLAVGRYDEQEQVIYIDGPEAKQRLAAWLDVDELDLGELAL